MPSSSTSDSRAERAQLPQNVGVPPAPELGLQPTFRDQQAEIFQAAGDRLHAGLAVEIGESRAGPQVDRRRQGRRRLLEISPLELDAALLRAALEDVKVERIRPHLDGVAVAARDDRVLA
jgi:hypothetical protein